MSVGIIYINRRSRFIVVAYFSVSNLYIMIEKKGKNEIYTLMGQEKIIRECSKS